MILKYENISKRYFINESLQFYLDGLVCVLGWKMEWKMKMEQINKKKKTKEPYVLLMIFDIYYRKCYKNKSRRFGN